MWSYDVTVPRRVPVDELVAVPVVTPVVASVPVRRVRRVPVRVCDAVVEVVDSERVCVPVVARHVHVTSHSHPITLQHVKLEVVPVSVPVHVTRRTVVPAPTCVPVTSTRVHVDHVHALVAIERRNVQVVDVRVPVPVVSTLLNVVEVERVVEVPVSHTVFSHRVLEVSAEFHVSSHSVKAVDTCRWSGVSSRSSTMTTTSCCGPTRWFLSRWWCPRCRTSQSS